MKKNPLLIITIIFLLFFLLLIIRQRRKKSSSLPDGSSGGSLVQSITTIKEYGKSMDWHHKSNLIAFAVSGEDGYWDVTLMNPDGSQEKCLTCDKINVPQKHNGNPSWHPSGDWIVFTAEKEEVPSQYDGFAIPGSGFGSDLWLTDKEGTEFYPLTEYPFVPPIPSVIHPQFSHDGRKIFWAETIGPGENFHGTWVLKIADFKETSQPYLENIQTLDLGDQPSFYESHAFSSDDQKIMFSGNLQKGQPPVGLDIYEYDLKTQKLNNLTNSFDDWDEHAHWSPDSTKISWMSSTGLKIDYETPPDKNWKKHLKTELWLMDADGGNRQRLTYFNESGHPDYLGRAIVSDSTWSPDGKSLIVLVAYKPSIFQKMKSKIVLVELK